MDSWYRLVMAYMVGKLLADIYMWFGDNWGKVIGLPLIGVGLVALAFITPWILIVYCLVLGTYLFNRS
jgi:hypothetical protein